MDFPFFQLVSITSYYLLPFHCRPLKDLSLSSSFPLIKYLFITYREIFSSSTIQLP